VLRAGCLGGVRADGAPGVGGRRQGVRVGPERDHDRLRAIRCGQPEETAEARALLQPGEVLVEKFEPALVDVAGRLEDVHPRKHGSTGT
jgi:hypothetical protein